MHIVDSSERHAKWQALVEDQEKSGLSQTEFCKQHNLVVSQFGYYRSLLKTKERTQPRKTELFSAVQIKKPETKPSNEIKVVLPNGFQCYLPISLDAVQIKKLMEVLLSC